MSEPFPAKRSFLSSCVFVLAMTRRTTVSHGRIYPYPFPPCSSSSSTMGFPCQFACLSVCFFCCRHNSQPSRSCSVKRFVDRLLSHPRARGLTRPWTTWLVRDGLSTSEHGLLAKVWRPRLFTFWLSTDTHQSHRLEFVLLSATRAPACLLFCFQLMQTNSSYSCSLHCPGMR